MLKPQVIDLAKELGVTSKDLMLAAEEMGHKGIRVMTALDSSLADALRAKMGKGRDPLGPRPIRVPRIRPTTDAGQVADAEARIRSAAERASPALNLRGLGLRQLPDALRKLTWIRWLNIGGNRLSTLPDYIGEFTNLHHLFLEGNQLIEAADLTWESHEAGMALCP